jgi:hypothetical protein
MSDYFDDPRRTRATFDRLVADLPDEAALWASGALDDTVLDILQTHSHPLPLHLLPRHVIAPAVIMGALCIEDRDPIDRNRLLHAIRRHSALYAGIVSVEDYPGRSAYELGIDARSSPSSGSTQAPYPDGSPPNSAHPTSTRPASTDAASTTRGTPSPKTSPSSSVRPAGPDLVARCVEIRRHRCARAAWSDPTSRAPKAAAMIGPLVQPRRRYRIVAARRSNRDRYR